MIIVLNYKIICVGNGMAMNKIKESVYHGTTDLRAKGILSSGFSESRKKTEWLGHGIYFFKYQADADWWAQLQIKRVENAGQNPVVLVTAISYTPDQLLDLDDRDQLQYFSDFFLKALKIAEKEFSLEVMLRKEKKETWCAACNLFRDAHPDIVVTAYTFQRFQDRSSFVYWPNQRQFCVSDCGIIGTPAILEEYL